MLRSGSIDYSARMAPGSGSQLVTAVALIAVLVTGCERYSINYRGGVDTLPSDRCLAHVADIAGCHEVTPLAEQSRGYSFTRGRDPRLWTFWCLYDPRGFAVSLVERDRGFDVAMQAEGPRRCDADTAALHAGRMAALFAAMTSSCAEETEAGRLYRCRNADCGDIVVDDDTFDTSSSGGAPGRSRRPVIEQGSGRAGRISDRYQPTQERPPRPPRLPVHSRRHPR